MESNKSQGELLSRLQYLFGYQYLSDLHNSLYTEGILYALRKTSIVSYSMEERVEAYQYVAGDKPEGASKEVLVDGMVRWLRAENKQGTYHWSGRKKRQLPDP